MEQLETTRRTFLALCAATAGAAMLPPVLRWRALSAYAAAAFSFTPHERAVLKAAANTVVPGGTVNTRLGIKTVPSAGDAGAGDYIEMLLTGAMLYAAGARRPPYVKLPPGVVAAVFPRQGAVPLWTVKRIGWFGDGPRPTRPESWPSELSRLQKLYQEGVKALDAAVAQASLGAVATFDDPGAVIYRDPILRRLHADEAHAYNGLGEGNQPFFLTFLDHCAQACFGDPVYGGNKDYAYWDMINFTGPSYTSFGGPAPGNGWTADDMTRQFDRSQTVAGA